MKKRKIIVNNENGIVDSIISFIKNLSNKAHTPTFKGIFVSYSEKKNQYTIEIKFKRNTFFINIINEQSINYLLIKESPFQVFKEDNFPLRQIQIKLGRIFFKLFTDNEEEIEAYKRRLQRASNNMYNSIFAVEPIAISQEGIFFSPPPSPPPRTNRTSRIRSVPFFNQAYTSSTTLAPTLTTIGTTTIPTRASDPPPGDYGMPNASLNLEEIRSILGQLELRGGNVSYSEAENFVASQVALRTRR